MDKSKRAKLKDELIKERQEVAEEIKHMSYNQLNGSMGDSTGELSSYDNHPADLGSEMFERSKDLSLRENLKHRLEHIDDALARMEQGTYGECELCGIEIAEERLEAMPSTTLCKKCKEADEFKFDLHDRPVEEKVVAPPFGGYYPEGAPEKQGDGSKDNMYDGEDAWQEVERYGTSDSLQDLAINTDSYQEMTTNPEEERGQTEDVDGIPYFRGADGMLYEDVYGHDDEAGPEEVIRGDEGWDKLPEKS